MVTVIAPGLRARIRRTVRPHQAAPARPVARGVVEQPQRAEEQRESWGDRHPVLSSLWVGLSAGMLVLTLALAILVIVLPKALGAVPLTVLSPSMEPTLRVGSLIVVLPIGPEEVRLGDIISYQPKPMDPTLVTHRVVSASAYPDGEHVFITKGDNNATEDEPVRGVQVRARTLYTIPYLGFVNSWVNVEQKPVIIWAVSGLLIAYMVYTFARALAARRKKRAEAARAPAPGRVWPTPAPYQSPDVPLRHSWARDRRCPRELRTRSHCHTLHNVAVERNLPPLNLPFPGPGSARCEEPGPG